MLTQLPESAHAALQQWASDRAQVLSRTVRGMMRYGDGLRVLARLEGVPEEEIEMVVASNPNPNPSPSPSPNLTLTLTLTRWSPTTT